MRTNFTYDESIDLRGSTDPLADFIAAGRGFCQQFSTLFALSMRAIGVPSRVVVGFTPGEPIAEDATTDEATTEETGNGDVELAVHGRQAHAWPEILVEGAGWVPLEPTPGRGDPAAAALTGVPPGQTVGEDRSAAAPTTAAPTTTNPVATTTTVPEGSPDEPTQVTAAGEPGGSGPNLWIASAALIGALAATIFVIWNRLRRRDRPVHGTDREDSVIARAWQDVCRELASRGIAAADSETPNEFARRAEPAMQALVQLADLETRRRWARDSPSGHDETVATELGNQLVLTLEANPPTESAQR
jgi:hypothetical protein